MDKIISADQTGYIRKQFIGTNIRKIIDIDNFLEKDNLHGVLLLLDFEKAFDTVEWPFLMSVLNKFNFGPDFCRWIKLIYSKHNDIIKIMVLCPIK